MNTLYELFKVNEDATIEEITENYNKIIEKAKSLPQTESLVQQIQRIKIAYGILSDPVKRKKYDLDLENKRAEELLKKVNETENISEESNISQIDEERIKQAIEEQINNAINEQEMNSLKTKMTEKSLKETEKLQRKIERKNRRQSKREQQYKREQEIYEYGAYLEKQGYKVKYPWTWLRIKRLIISLIAVIITLIILWNIPFIRNMLLDLYDKNFVIKFLVDLILSMFKWIIESIKAIF